MSALEIALRRIDQLQRELADLEHFVSMYHRLSVNQDTVHTKPVENSRAKKVNYGSKPSKRSSATSEIVSLIEGIIRDLGRPMTRTELVAPLEARDVHIAGADKARYLGTVLWRNRDRFRNLPSYGYWLRDLPYPPAGYDPLTDNEFESWMDSEAGFAERHPLTGKTIERYDDIKIEIAELDTKEIMDDLTAEQTKRLQSLRRRKAALEKYHPELLKNTDL